MTGGAPTIPEHVINTFCFFTTTFTVVMFCRYRSFFERNHNFLSLCDLLKIGSTFERDNVERASHSSSRNRASSSQRRDTTSRLLSMGSICPFCTSNLLLPPASLVEILGRRKNQEPCHWSSSDFALKASREGRGFAD